MDLKYITYSELLCSKLALLGFKRKNRAEFIRKQNGFNQMISYCHSSRIPHVRDYYIIIGLYYPEVEKMGMDLDVYTTGAWGLNIGYLTPQKIFKEWRVENSASEDDIREVVNDMVNLIETYAVPFFDRYFDVNELIFELEVGTLLIPHHADYNLPLLYLLNGEKGNAISVLDRELKRKELIFKNSNKDCLPEAQDNNNSYVSPTEREYKAYKEFAEKLSARIEQMC